MATRIAAPTPSLAWTRGIPLARLRPLEALFKQALKPYTHGAFGIPNGAEIATAWFAGELRTHLDPEGKPQAAALFRVLKARSRHKDFSGSVVARPGRGHLYVRALASESIEAESALVRELMTISGAQATWVEAPIESHRFEQIAATLGGRLALTKISAASDLRGLWCFGDASTPAYEDRLHPAQRPGLVELDEAVLTDPSRQQILEELRAYQSGTGERWAQHYSTYNQRHSWTAFALKGYDPGDPGFIQKPAEMSSGWKKQNPHRLNAGCDWTRAAPHFQRTIALLVSKIPCEFQRVRFMRLASGNGELTRHADITDPEAGVLDGQIARLHVPIETGRGCEFRSWGLDGAIRSAHLPSGSLWYLDTRKPHAVVNQAEVDRVHLVVDVRANEWLRDRIARANSS